MPSESGNTRSWRRSLARRVAGRIDCLRRAKDGLKAMTADGTTLAYLCCFSLAGGMTGGCRCSCDWSKIDRQGLHTARSVDRESPIHSQLEAEPDCRNRKLDLKVFLYPGTSPHIRASILRT